MAGAGIVAAILACILVYGYVWGKKALGKEIEAEESRRFTGRGKAGQAFGAGKGIHAVVFCVGLFLLRLRDRYLGERTGRDPSRYIGTKKRRQERAQEARTFGLGFMVLFAGAVLTLTGFFFKKEPEVLTALSRPEFGEEKKVELSVRGLSEDDFVTLSLLSREPEDKEMEEVFDRVYEEALSEALSGNASFREVRKNLSFPEESEEGICFVWVSDQPEVLSGRGIITAEEIPEEGLDCVLRVTLKYGTHQKSYIQEVTVLPEEKELTEKERLLMLLEERNEANREEGTIILPETMDDKKLTFETVSSSPWLYFGMALVIGAVMLFLPSEKRKEKEKKREEILVLSYPGLVSRLKALILANLSIRHAWERIIREKKEALKKGVEDPLYDEMVVTWMQLNQGMAEGEAYVDFGRRCGIRSYQRLGNLLKNNLRQGISGLEGALQKELQQALSDRKHTALTLGEKAGTRLLFPMLLMLLVIIAALILPAFLSF